MKVSNVDSKTIDPKEILAAAKRILLVDWPSTDVPRALIAAGFAIFGYSPNGYSEAKLFAEPPIGNEGVSVFPLENDTDEGYLVFRRLEETPGNVDIVNVFRPAEELPGIIERHLLPLGAKVLWLQPPNTSAKAAEMAKGLELAFIENIDISEVARQITTN